MHGTARRTLPLPATGGTVALPTAEVVREFGDDLPTPAPSWRTLVLVRRDGDWKIAHTHVSPAN